MTAEEQMELQSRILKNKSEVTKALLDICKEHGGLLKAEDVVQAASDPESLLHSYFIWDDTEAAKRYRLWQARQLIRVCVESIQPVDEVPTRIYVSLIADRKQPGGGYRLLTEVLVSADLREQLLRQATAEFHRWEQKYRHLQELAEVFAAMKRVEEEIERSKQLGQESLIPILP